MSNCLISIVTISRNDFQGLLKTLDSVKGQDYEYIEHIIVDGDSNDGTREILQSYQHTKNFSYVSEPDNGISSAFNKGLDRSTGDLIFFLNSGDLFFSKSVVSEVVSSYIKYKWKCAVGSRIVFVKGEEFVYSPPKLPSNFLKYFMFLPHQAFFCETNLHKNYKFDESLKHSMDYDVFIRMLREVEIFYLSVTVAKSAPAGASKGGMAEQSQIRSKYATNPFDKFIINIINRLLLLKTFFKISSPFAIKFK
ncbi:glycosyltransferase [Anabaena sp. FACHB-1250]|jgi:glycosyltransferase involved in cell wall biosynthesis|uniref:glycosyltransferase family 2 protein n=1 Tax=Anabaena sp. FACHB-1250 TaxID=2692770 RepID=UPI001680B929|nr:glycosyltransferase family 2 protein [Anabaena sp. FACHB-1250]MBD2140278.1 glycosyltransferase [Anabaena sp. FACHB-1250]